MHTCRKWRRIVFESQQALDLRLFCTRGTPLLKSLYCWPALPIVVQYGGSLEDDLPTPEDKDNIVAAFKRPHRVISISLTVTPTIQGMLSTIESPFAELEHLVLLSQDAVRSLIQPRAFWSGQWGTRLRSLHLTRIALLELPRLLYSSKNLVDLQLHDVPYPSNFSIAALTTALSGLTQLRSLSLRFLPPIYYHFATFLPSSKKRVALPSLTRFDFRGITSFLDSLVAGIDAPRLGEIGVTIVEESESDLSVLIEFIDRIKLHKSPRRADIKSSEYDITISLTQPGSSTGLKLTLPIMSSGFVTFDIHVAIICYRFADFLVNVEDLRLDLHINAQQLPTLDYDIYDGRWRWFIELFVGVKWLQVSGNLSSDIVNSLQIRDHDRWRTPVLPALHKIHILQPGPCHELLRKAIASLITSRLLSGHHPIAVEYNQVLLTSELGATGTVYYNQ